MGWSNGKGWMSSDGGWYGPPAAAPSYTGPGDIYSFSVWFGLRAYNAAYASPGTNPAIDIVDQAGANPLTVKILSTGNLDVASIATWVTAHSVTTIYITKVYDQTGGGNHVTQATLANMPQLQLNAIGTLPLILFTTIGQNLLSAASFTQTSPMTASTVAMRNPANSSNFDFVISDDFTAGGFGFLNGANTAGMYSAQDSVTATDGSLHALQYLSSSAANTCFVSSDGTNGTTVVGAMGNWNGKIGFGTNNTVAFSHQGTIGEAGIASGNQTSHNATMNSNQHAYWGF
jgi:hypothetical protein